MLRAKVSAAALAGAFAGTAGGLYATFLSFIDPSSFDLDASILLLTMEVVGGARTLAVTNGGGSPLTQVADLAFVTSAGAELAVPATKTFTTQLAALAVLAIALGADLDPGLLAAVPDEIERMLAEPDDLKPMVADLAGAAGVVVSGRGHAYAAALELALKLKEACYLHAMGLSYADLLHGPIAVVDSRTPAVIVTLPTNGSDEQAFRANEWMVRQALAVGIHGILLCHAESPAAVGTVISSTVESSWGRC